jgi:hypothetical protein
LYHITLLRDRNFHATLLQFDEDLAAEVRARGCPCGGRLHRADYPRKPRGGPADLGPAYDWRHSFCCDQDGCRRRATPASLRFLGRRVYLSVVVVLVSVLAHGLTPTRLATLRDELGGSLSGRTIARWRTWWREAFPHSPFWKQARGRFSPPVDRGRLPASLLARFRGQTVSLRLRALLAFLAPLTVSRATSLRDGSPPAEDAAGVQAPACATVPAIG